MKRIIAMLLSLVLLVSLCACGEKVCEHTFEGPTCTEAKTCTQCGETAAEALNHNWMPSNCKELSRGVNPLAAMSANGTVTRYSTAAPASRALTVHVPSHVLSSP